MTGLCVFVQATNTPKYLNQLMKEVSTFLCYEATASLKLESCEVKTRVQSEQGQRVAERVGVVPVLRGGLGMVEAMTEMVSNAQVWHLGIYRDKKSLLPIEYYNKLPKQVCARSAIHCIRRSSCSSSSRSSCSSSRSCSTAPVLFSAAFHLSSYCSHFRSRRSPSTLAMCSTRCPSLVRRLWRRLIFSRRGARV